MHTSFRGARELGVVCSAGVSFTTTKARQNNDRPGMSPVYLNATARKLNASFVMFQTQRNSKGYNVNSKWTQLSDDFSSVASPLPLFTVSAPNVLPSQGVTPGFVLANCKCVPPASAP